MYTIVLSGPLNEQTALRNRALRDHGIELEELADPTAGLDAPDGHAWLAFQADDVDQVVGHCRGGWQLRAHWATQENRGDRGASSLWGDGLIAKIYDLEDRLAALGG